MEYFNILDLGMLTCKWMSARPHAKESNYFYINFNEWVQSAYLLVPIGDGIFYSVLCIVHILHFFSDFEIGVPGCSPVSCTYQPLVLPLCCYVKVLDFMIKTLKIDQTTLYYKLL